MAERRPTLLDLFCGAGGATRGYQRAGFTVTGVDHVPQPRYCGDAFVQADALAYVAAHGHEYEVIHASPPCQAYSALKHFTTREHPMLIDEVRNALRATGRPYMIENVVGAPLDTTVLLCGSMFGLATPCGAQLRRHRLFEASVLLLAPGPCQHEGRRTITVTGSTPQQNVERNWIRETFSVHDARIAMGIDWMGMADLSQAIPPAYTTWIGRQILRALEVAHAPHA